ncbi:thiamine phosphate synthase [Jeotgalibacillus salarius]|uniref:Thiamine-phosphate synthase n=1 Tax=Jeotgalibacillus salarius TaxID=546023 RepID=A0A4Y8LCU4_9BACL|nr:thiamine phosphate synthase [Jeotgalibacillus salarius]TFE00504.1 thiamine phosphate synthase [Jeotgalibacillus salarius]
MYSKPSIYFILGTQNAVNRDPLKLLEEALKGGINYFQLREKGSNALVGRELKEFALKCQSLCRLHNVPFIVNDDVDLAHDIQADGIHVGQEDLSAASVRAYIGKGMTLGVSVHSVEEAKRALEDGADYLGMGPVYGTNSKSDAKKPSGVTKIEEVKKRFPVAQVIGIGGITSYNAGPVWEAGAAGIAVISAIVDAENIAEEIRRLKISCTGVE